MSDCTDRPRGGSDLNIRGAPYWRLRPWSKFFGISKHLTPGQRGPALSRHHIQVSPA